MATVTIPVELENPRYFFQVVLNQNPYQLSLRWNGTASAWFMDLYGIENGEDIKGIRLSTGPNLLKPYAIVDLGAMYVIDGEERGEDPTFEGLGSRWLLIHTDEPDLII